VEYFSRLRPSHPDDAAMKQGILSGGALAWQSGGNVMHSSSHRASQSHRAASPHSVAGVCFFERQLDLDQVSEWRRVTHPSLRAVSKHSTVGGQKLRHSFLENQPIEGDSTPG
jgi:hypothetical protein